MGFIFLGEEQITVLVFQFAHYLQHAKMYNASVYSRLLKFSFSTCLSGFGVVGCMNYKQISINLSQDFN